MPMDVTKCIAANVKALREKKKLTLDSAAQATGVSRSMLAQIEKGDVNPTISVLWRSPTGSKFLLPLCWKRKSKWMSAGEHRQSRLWKTVGATAITQFLGLTKKSCLRHTASS